MNLEVKIKTESSELLDVEHAYDKTEELLEVVQEQNSSGIAALNHQLDVTPAKIKAETGLEKEIRDQALFDVPGFPTFETINANAESPFRSLYLQYGPDSSLSKSDIIASNNTRNRIKKYRQSHGGIPGFNKLSQNGRNDKKDKEVGEKNQLNNHLVVKSSRSCPASDDFKNCFKKSAFMRYEINSLYLRKLPLDPKKKNDALKNNGNEIVYPLDFSMKSMNMQKAKYNQNNTKPQDSVPETDQEPLIDLSKIDNNKNILPFQNSKACTSSVNRMSVDSNLVSLDTHEHDRKQNTIKISDLKKMKILKKFKEMSKESNFNKELYVEMKMILHPINIEYNPKKSRNFSRFINGDEETTEARSKNNIASRLSRHKKKNQHLQLSFENEILQKEIAHLYMYKEWITKFGKLIKAGLKHH